MKTTQQFPEASDTILIVDDSPDNLTVMKKVLENALPAVTVLTCQHPEKAQTLLQETEVALAVLDVQMPKIDGLELCKRIKNDTATPFVSVILITSHDSDPRMRAKGMALGADDFVTRPMDNAELCARVKVALRVHRAESILRGTAGRAEAEAAQLGHVLEESLNEIFIIDAETMHFLNANRGARKNIGYSMEELRGMTPLDLTPEINPEAFEALIKPLRDGSEKKIQIEGLHRRKDGTDYPVEAHLQLMSGDLPVFVAIIIDITERKLAAAALRESENKYRDLAENLEAILWDYDFHTDCWTYVSPQSERILGYAPEEWVNFDFWVTHLHEEDRERAVSFCEVQTLAEKAHEFECRFLKKNGEIVWLNDVVNVKMEDGKPVSLRGMITDITERKQAEQSLKERNRELERFNRASVGRELKMIDLKKEINALCEKQGKPQTYPVAQSQGAS